MNIKNLFDILLIEESDPEKVANRINKFEKENSMNSIDSLLKMLVNEAKNNTTSYPAKTKINLNDKEQLNKYIQDIISYLNIKDKIHYQQIIIKLNNFKNNILNINNSNTYLGTRSI